MFEMRLRRRRRRRRETAVTATALGSWHTPPLMSPRNSGGTEAQLQHQQKRPQRVLVSLLVRLSQEALKKLGKQCGVLWRRRVEISLGKCEGDPRPRLHYSAQQAGRSLLEHPRLGNFDQEPEHWWRSGMVRSDNTNLTSNLHYLCCRKFQKSTNLLIPKLPFSRVIREICSQVKVCWARRYEDVDHVLSLDLFQRPEVPDRSYHGSPGGDRGLHGDSLRGQSSLHHSCQESDPNAERYGPRKKDPRGIRDLVNSSEGKG